MSEYAFFMVQGSGPAYVRHESRHSAEQEAQRLARANPGQHFYVMASLCGFVKDDVRRVDFDLNTNGELPF